MGESITYDITELPSIKADNYNLHTDTHDDADADAKVGTAIDISNNIYTNTFRIFYGFTSKYLDITPVVIDKYVSETTNNIVIIARDANREILFGNPVPDVYKHIVIIDNSMAWIFPHNIKVQYSIENHKALSPIIESTNDIIFIASVLNNTYAILNKRIIDSSLEKSIYDNPKWATKLIAKTQEDLCNSELKHLKDDISENYFNIDKTYTAYNTSYYDDKPIPKKITFIASAPINTIPLTYPKRALFNPNNRHIVLDPSGTSILTTYNNIASVKIPIDTAVLSKSASQLNKNIYNLSMESHKSIPYLATSIHSIIHNKILLKYPSAIQSGAFSKSFYNEILRIISTTITLNSGAFNRYSLEYHYLLETIKPFTKAIYLGTDTHGIQSIIISSLLNSSKDLLTLNDGAINLIKSNRDANGYLFDIFGIVKYDSILDKLLEKINKFCNTEESTEHLVHSNIITLILHPTNNVSSLLFNTMFNSAFHNIHRIIINKHNVSKTHYDLIIHSLYDKGYNVTKINNNYSILRRI